MWTPRYTVTYNGNGSTSGTLPVDTTSYLSTASVAPLSHGALVKSGYTFTGWNTAADGSGINRPVGTSFVIGAANVTLYAQWTIIADTTPPSVTGFALPEFSTSTTVTLTTFTTSETTGVSYLITESATIPAGAVWLTTKPTSYTVTAAPLE